MVKKCILLSLVEAMYFIDKKDGALPVHPSLVLGHGNRLADILYASQHSVDSDEMSLGGVGDDTG